MGTDADGVDAVAAACSWLRLAPQAMFKLERDGFHSQARKQNKQRTLIPSSRYFSLPRGSDQQAMVCSRARRLALHCTALYRDVRTVP